jgi:hypothetical protein
MPTAFSDIPAGSNVIPSLCSPIAPFPLFWVTSGTSVTLGSSSSHTAEKKIKKEIQALYT